MTTARGAFGLLDRLFGAAAMGVLSKRAGGVVVLYHRVSAENDPIYPPLHPRDFSEHLDLLTTHFDVLPGAEWIARVRRGLPLRRCCTITFDDGYRDFVDHALPELSRRALPATHFLIVSCLREGVEPWTLQARRLGWSGDLSPLGGLPHDERTARLSARGSIAGGANGARMLAVDDIPTLLRADVEIGSHTLSHAWLTHCDVQTLDAELGTSRRLLSELCDRPIRFVSYPQGLSDDRVLEVAVRAGYDGGFVVDQTATRPGTDPMAVPRFDLTDKPVEMVRLELSGVVEWARRMRRGG